MRRFFARLRDKLIMEKANKATYFLWEKANKATYLKATPVIVIVSVIESASASEIVIESVSEIQLLDKSSGVVGWIDANQAILCSSLN